MKNEKRQVFNPFLPSYEYIPDGEPHVFGDRIYLFGSHDRFNGDVYCQNDYVCYSAPTDDLSDWKYEGVIYRRDQDPRNTDGNHYMWAPDVAKGPDGRYYLYYCMDVFPEIAVAVSDTPAGKYEYLGLVRHADGGILGCREKDYPQFDPAVFVDEDGKIYLYSGNADKDREHHSYRNSQVMRLSGDMLTIEEEVKVLIPLIHNSEGTGFEGHEFFEASSMRKINGKYYFIYSDINSASLCYAVSPYPDKDFQYGGVLVHIGDVGIDGRTEAEALNFLGNTHGSLECVEGIWYVFYHRQTNGTNFSRQACAEKVEIQPDGKIRQAEITSCGLNGGPLQGRGRYEARIACNLRAKDGVVISKKMYMDERFPYFTQDGEDREDDPNQYIANIKDGTMAGFKYFRLPRKGGIEVRVRGTAEGKFLVFADDREKIGEIMIRADAGEWESFSGEYSLDTAEQEKTTALYFVFQGTGKIDFYDFCLKEYIRR